MQKSETLRDYLPSVMQSQGPGNQKVMAAVTSDDLAYFRCQAAGVSELASGSDLGKTSQSGVVLCKCFALSLKVPSPVTSDSCPW
jgi:hypothetical protein